VQDAYTLVFGGLLLLGARAEAFNIRLHGCIKTFRQARGWAGRMILRGRWWRSQ